MAARKTASVAVILDRVNYFLANSEDERTDAREAVAALLEGVLMDTDNYAGFRFTDLTTAPGAPWRVTDFGDETRREYYASLRILDEVRARKAEREANGGLIPV